MPTQEMSRSSRFLLIVILISMCLLVTAASLIALPFIVQALPGRYAYYLPEFLQEWRHVDHPDTLPTPSLLSTLPPPTPTPTGSPAAPTGAPAIPTASPVPPPQSPLPTSHFLAGMQHEPQGWNNCGPTTLAMALSYWGRPETQYEVAPAVKPDPEDKNVGPEEMAEYVASLGLESVVRVGGNLDLLKRLLASDFPVIVETWYVREADDQMGHYRLIIGYDDTAQEFLTHDSLHGPDLPIGYQELDELWLVFNRLYMVVYPTEQTAELAAVLGVSIDESMAHEQALAMAQADANGPPIACVALADCADAEAFAWFNVGSNLVALERHEEAATAFDRARMLGLPWRMLWYQFGPYQAYYAVGRYGEVITLADVTLAVVNNLEESYYWRGLARQAFGDEEGARQDFEAALSFHENWRPAMEALTNLEQ